MFVNTGPSNPSIVPLSPAIYAPTPNDPASMSCSWIQLSEVALVCDSRFESSGYEILYKIFPENSPTLRHGETGTNGTTSHYVYPDNLVSQNSPRSYFASNHEPPFFCTAIIWKNNMPRTIMLDEIKPLYRELRRSKIDVEYIVCFQGVWAIFIVCRNQKAAELVLKFLLGSHTFTEVRSGKIYTPEDYSIMQDKKIEVWSHVSLWVSVEGSDLRLRVRAIGDLFKEFQDLSWQFQGNCHHRSGDNDRDKEGEITLWVETSGTRKDFTILFGKEKQSVKTRPGLGSRKTDGTIEIIKTGIQNALSEGKVVVGLRLIFVKVQDAKDFKSWLVSSLVINKEKIGDSSEDCGLKYPPTFPVSAMRRPQIPSSQTTSFRSSSATSSGTKSSVSHSCDLVTGQN